MLKMPCVQHYREFCCINGHAIANFNGKQYYMVYYNSPSSFTMNGMPNPVKEEVPLVMPMIVPL